MRRLPSLARSSAPRLSIISCSGRTSVSRPSGFDQIAQAVGLMSITASRSGPIGRIPVADVRGPFAAPVFDDALERERRKGMGAEFALQAPIFMLDFLLPLSR